VPAQLSDAHDGYVNPFTPRISYGDVKVTLTFESVDEILCCDHSYETSSSVFSHGAIYILVYYKRKFGFSLNFGFWHSWD